MAIVGSFVNYLNGFAHRAYSSFRMEGQALMEDQAIHDAVQDESGNPSLIEKTDTEKPSNTLRGRIKTMGSVVNSFFDRSFYIITGFGLQNAALIEETHSEETDTQKAPISLFNRLKTASDIMISIINTSTNTAYYTLTGNSLPKFFSDEYMHEEMFQQDENDDSSRIEKTDTEMPSNTHFSKINRIQSIIKSILARMPDIFPDIFMRNTPLNY